MASAWNAEIPSNNQQQVNASKSLKKKIFRTSLFVPQFSLYRIALIPFFLLDFPHDPGPAPPGPLKQARSVSHERNGQQQRTGFPASVFLRHWQLCECLFCFFFVTIFQKKPHPLSQLAKKIYKPPLPRRTSPSPSAEFCQLTVPPAKKKKKALFTQYVALFQSPYSSSRTNDADGIE